MAPYPSEQEDLVNTDAKKVVLRMIPYGIYVLTAEAEGNLAASTVNWVTQSAFAPPLVVVGVKADSGTYKSVKAAQAFALNMLGKEQKALAFTFYILSAGGCQRRQDQWPIIPQGRF
jgi:flavin reductase (DIM6/NTAB) family NADH-FMN oxidoreductase RutF